MSKMHLMWFCAFSPHAHFDMDGWHGPHTGGYEWSRPELWQDMAQCLEEAKFDVILVGDSLAVPYAYQGRTDAYLRHAEHAPFHDPMPLVSMMACATRHIGLGATLSTTFYPPYLLSRMMSTFDHLSRGRAAWNVVTSYKDEEAQNFGYKELLGHDERYERADEFMELCYRLWGSWEKDAVVMDAATNTFADPSKVHPVNFEGRYYRSRGPLCAMPSPQGRPVIIQAGTSPRGQDFAAKHAEAIIVSKRKVEEMKEFYDGFKERMRTFGRQPEECKVFFLVKPMVRDSAEAAQTALEEMERNVSVEAGVAALSVLLQVDLSQYDLDKPLPSMNAGALKGTQSQYTQFASFGEPTLRELAILKFSIDTLPIMGSPEDVADTMVKTMDEVGGDGFGIQWGMWPGYVKPFTERVVPLLQRRGAARTEYTGSTLRDNLLEF